MSILDKLSEAPTHMRRTSDFGAPPITEIDCKPTGEIRPYQLHANEEFELSAKLAVRFWANPVERAAARRIAERVLLQRLYGDTLALLSEVEKAVYDGDAAAVIGVINKIRTNLVGN